MTAPRYDNSAILDTIQEDLSLECDIYHNVLLVSGSKVILIKPSLVPTCPLAGLSR